MEKMMKVSEKLAEVRGQSKQSGFTFIELLVVLAILGLVVLYFNSNSGGKTDSARAALAKTHITKDILEAATAYATINNLRVDGLTKADITGRDVQGDTPWGTAWTMSDPTANDNLVSLAYPIGGDDADAMGADLDAEIDRNPQLTATYAAATNVLTVVIEGP